jgi:hypothetical protein
MLLLLGALLFRKIDGVFDFFSRQLLGLPRLPTDSRFKISKHLTTYTLKLLQAYQEIKDD